MPFISVSSSSVRPSDRPWEVETFPTPADAEGFADDCYAGEHVRNFRRERERDQMRLGHFFPKALVPRHKRARLTPRQAEVQQAIAAEITRDLHSDIDVATSRRTPEALVRQALAATGARLGVPRALALLQGACLALWETGILRGLGIHVPTPVRSPVDVMESIGNALDWLPLPMGVST